MKYQPVVLGEIPDYHIKAVASPDIEVFYTGKPLIGKELQLAVDNLIEAIIANGCTVKWVTTPKGSLALQTYKRAWTGGNRLLGQYVQKDMLCTAYHAYLESHNEPSSPTGLVWTQ